jgi:DNA replication protein DnaC
MTQADARRERAVARRIREARFAENKALEGFNWLFNPKAFDRVQIEELATGDFIRRKTNLVMVGWSGVGKSHIVQAVGQKACVRGYRVMYRTSADLLADLTASLADKTLPARLRRYANPDYVEELTARHENYNRISYGLFAVGWLLALAGKMYKVGGSSDGE